MPSSTITQEKQATYLQYLTIHYNTLYVYVCMCICLCICTCVYVYMSTYMRVHVCMSVCVHSHPNAPEPVAASNYVPANTYNLAGSNLITCQRASTAPCTRASASLRPVAGSIYALAVALTKARLSAVCASPLPAASSPAPQPLRWRRQNPVVLQFS